MRLELTTAAKAQKKRDPSKRVPPERVSRYKKGAKIDLVIPNPLGYYIYFVNDLRVIGLVIEVLANLVAYPDLDPVALARGLVNPANVPDLKSQITALHDAIRSEAQKAVDERGYTYPYGVDAAVNSIIHEPNYFKDAFILYATVQVPNASAIVEEIMRRPGGSKKPFM